ncbi:BCCT family transporter [Corynebacterium halotolerans]|uniref:Transporter n=1 Tax=Corynebacterium halotolerans YIM 70093 = DSM 44683 TaxID=1121362 RepID=M1NL12_9CORY|nr:BCCT family transporter [Corynebacterium halotolerans]AGF72078.1 transporter [Corynebacterium halotolerans YIM 70093 = DSM 44683]
MLERLARSLRLKTDPPVYFAAVGIVVVFVAVTILFGDWVSDVFGTASDWVLSNLGWFYVLGVTVFLIFLVFVALSRYGHVRLGADDERPEYSTLAWFAMLFAAGIGTILMFWGVAEPISHFANPPIGDTVPGSVEAAEQAIAITHYHFGLHTWTIFTLPALCFAYFIYKRKMPPRVSSIFSPLLGAKVYGPIGKTIDVAALIGTVFGVATSVGLGTLQINAGLAELFGIEFSPLVQVVVIVVVTAIASVSVALGLDRGIKILSNINIWMAIGLMIFVILAGPTVLVLKGTIESVGTYLSWLPELAFWNNTVPNSPDNATWQNTWTVFYWAWTITWSPFVGIFIARISRGRTIRQFVVGVLGLPVTFSLIWFGSFGTSAFNIERNGDGGLVNAVAVEGDIPGALFEFLSNYPAATFVSGLAIVIVIIFFTTSVDSAAMVTDMIASGREPAFAPTHQKLIWTVLMGAVAAVLLAATGEGGLSALQQTIIVVGLPFFIMGFIMMFSLGVALKNDTGDPMPTVTRQWDSAQTAEEWERNEESPSPEPIGPIHHIPDDNGDETVINPAVVGAVLEEYSRNHDDPEDPEGTGGSYAARPDGERDDDRDTGSTASRGRTGE